jgi:NAD-dependent deacetylase
MKWAVCLECRKRYPFEEIKARLDAGEDIPICPNCGGTLKPDVVMFGEQLPYKVLEEAGRRARSADLFIVIGSTLVVYPAAYMPAYAVESGARLVIINLGDTPMDREATVLVSAKAGEAMAAIVKKVKEKTAL